MKQFNQPSPNRSMHNYSYFSHRLISESESTYHLLVKEPIIVSTETDDKRLSIRNSVSILTSFSGNVSKTIIPAERECQLPLTDLDKL